MPNVIIACEKWQRTCKAFLDQGFNAFSCDIQECAGGRPDRHICGDVLPLLNGNCTFKTQDGVEHRIDGTWDLIIAHPPCTYLTVTGNRWFNEKLYGEKAVKRAAYRQEAYEFFMKFVNADCDHIAIENPIGYMSSHYRKPDQIIQPYQFGEHARKATCLWLKGLPTLKPTEIVEPDINTYYGKTGKSTISASHDVRGEDGHLLSWTDPRVADMRSMTFLGVANAFCDQWGRYIEENAK